MTTRAKDAWEHLRGSRWNPAGAASMTTERRLTYQTALQQAEEMFTAAAQVGPATRPVLAFYGLSQAGRAIAANASTAHGDNWRLNGHGIRALDLDKPLPELIVKTDKAGTTGSFVRLSELLDSPVWEKTAVDLGRLWTLLPENIGEAQALHDNHRIRLAPLKMEPVRFGDLHALASAMVWGFPAWLGREADIETAFEEYLSKFPRIDGYLGYLRHGSGTASTEPWLIYDEAGDRYTAQIHWEMARQATDDQRVHHLHRLATWYAGDYYFLPEVDPVGTLHPLMAWWAILYTLSMLARYHPAAWNQSHRYQQQPVCPANREAPRRRTRSRSAVDRRGHQRGLLMARLAQPRLRPAELRRPCLQ